MTSMKRKCRTCIHCDIQNLICRPDSKDWRSEYKLDIDDLDNVVVPALERINNA